MQLDSFLQQLEAEKKKREADERRRLMGLTMQEERRGSKDSFSKDGDKYTAVMDQDGV